MSEAQRNSRNSRSGGPQSARRAQGQRGGRRGNTRPGSEPRKNDRGDAGQVSPRTVAYDVLRDVEDQEAYANLALAQRIRMAQLSGLDAAFVTELVGGTLRGRGRYDRIIEIASGRAIDEVDVRTRNVLRLGVHQILGMRVSDHAAVNESVELQRRVGNQNAAGFVNGVLRTVTRTSVEEWQQAVIDSAPNPDEALALGAAHPAWIVRALRGALAAEGRGEELDEMLAANNTSPIVNVALLPGFASVEEERELPSELVPVGPSPTGYELEHGNPTVVFDLAGLPEGALRVQDQGSQLAALALSRARPLREGERWLDLCAGPGGKTALLAAEARLGGATVRANEVAPHRADLVRNAVHAVQDVVEVVSHDGREAAAYGDGTHEPSFDRIMVDAPCSGLGALRRRPEARWRKQPTDIPELSRLQEELLLAAADRLAEGGVLAYVTCSPHLAETRVIVDRVLRARPELAELDTRAVLSEVTRDQLDLGGTAKHVQLWPHRHGTDAMFIALLERSN